MAAEETELMARIIAKLEPSRIRSTLMFSSLLQLVHQLIKESVLTGVKGFFGYSDVFGKGEWLLGESRKADYEASVLALAPGSAFNASTIWLEQAGAITEVQRARLDEIYGHRHALTHELARFIVDVDREPDVSILTDALAIERDIDRFWIRVEKDLGTFDDHGDVSVDQVVSGPAMIIQMCLDAYLGRSGAQSEGVEAP